jgi:asparagine synthase (glutamine-hydrolysing)
MCGIAGFTTFGSTAVDRKTTIDSMCAQIIPRGPDGHGRHLDDHITLGHRRLSIIDIEGGSQPMSTEDGRFHIVYNGETYNYVELRAELEKKGLSFSTQSDTEVILKLIAREGPQGLAKVNGMFAFALWDRNERSLLIARDRIGIKPLYYATNRGNLIFASEMKALLQHPDLSRHLDSSAIAKYFAYNYIPAPHTAFKDIHKLEPGTYAVFTEDAGLQKHLYWDIPLSDRPISTATIDECSEELLVLLQDAVSKRLRSDVPVGVFLSGGIDSSAITALAARASSNRISTFSVGFDESSYDESPYALQVAQMYNTDHHHQVLSARDALDMLPTVSGILDEPFGDASILPTYLLSRYTAGHVKVALGGDGGDELFLGYPSFQAHKIMNSLSVLPVGWRDGLVRMARRLPISHRYASAEYLLQQFFKGAGISPEIRFMLWMASYGNDERRSLFSEDLKASLRRTNVFDDVIGYVRQSGLVRDLERLQYLCMKLYLQDDILVKVDRASMANSLEVRVPFLDHGVVEFVATIGDAYKLKGLSSKHILKRTFRDLLPPSIIKRRKAGFMIPLASWLSNELRDLVEDVCSEDRIKREGLFDPGYVRFMLDAHFSKKRDFRKMIWVLLTFQLWRDNYL